MTWWDFGDGKRRWRVRRKKEKLTRGENVNVNKEA
jgi:hypothetical protein